MKTKGPARQRMRGAIPASGEDANGSRRIESGPDTAAGWAFHLAGQVRRVLAALFPATPPRPARGGRRLAWLIAVNVAAIAVGAAVLLYRQAGTPSWDTIWAEDYGQFLPRAVLHPWSSLLQPQAGYRQLLPQVIADVAARFGLRYAAAGLAIGGAVTAACCAVFSYHASGSHIRLPWLRGLLACSVLLLPTAVIEIANSAVDAQWYVMFALFWALLWRPRTRAGHALAAVIGFVALASNILNLLYLPLVVARLVALPRIREHAVTCGWLAGLAFQLPVVLATQRPAKIAPLSAGMHFYGQHVLVPAVVGWRLSLHLQAAIGVPAAIALAAVVVAGLVCWAAVAADTRVRILTGAALAMSLIMAVIPAMLRSWVATAASTSIWLPGSRYTATSILLIYLIALAGVDAYLRRAGPLAEGSHPPIRPGKGLHSASLSAASLPEVSQRRAGRRAGRRVAAVAALTAVLAIGWGTSFRYANLRSTSPPWSQTYTRYARFLAHEPSPGHRQRPAGALGVAAVRVSGNERIHDRSPGSLSADTGRIRNRRRFPRS